MKTPLRAAPAIPRCVIYARCSAEKQAEKDLSIPAQLDAARQAARQRGWEVSALALACCAIAIALSYD